MNWMAQVGCRFIDRNPGSLEADLKKKEQELEKASEELNHYWSELNQAKLDLDMARVELFDEKKKYAHQCKQFKDALTAEKAKAEQAIKAEREEAERSFNAGCNRG